MYCIINEDNNYGREPGIMSNSPIHEKFISSSNVTTGGDNESRHLYYQLRMGMSKAKSVDLIVSFLMESGVSLILDDLKDILDRGGRVRILTGNYLGITQPSALYMIRASLGDAVDLRFFNERSRSFHPKSYIFHYENHSEIFIGSSNLSRSALTSGIEWNFRFSSLDDESDYQKFYNTFVDLFENHSIVVDDEELKRYSKNWHKPAVYKDLNRYDDQNEIVAQDKITPMYRPRGAQIEALYALQQNRSEGAARALVHAATGIGKTYLAAFDSRNYRRVLYVAHRQEILNQARASFANIRDDEAGFFGNNRKDTSQNLIFAMVETLGKKKYLNDQYFKPDDFDYIVIDEFHHAVTNQYHNIIEYFHPKFLLGLTATPERMDGRDIYELCYFNVPFELNMRDAINKGMLVPFHYYGIYDDTDYSGLHLVRGHYDELDLEKIYIGNQRRYDLIYKYYQKYPSKRALGFCSSRKHAEDMAKEFAKRGIKAAAVYSGGQGEHALDRDQALARLRDGDLNVLFSVDMFNEGVDVPNIDLVMFLRPTESPIVFLQQLGRGLRKAKGKEYLTVLDFIGNYQRAGNTLYLLSGDGKRHGTTSGERIPKEMYPDDCIVDFDMHLIDLFKQMQKRSQKKEDIINQEIYRIKDELGHVPSRMELFNSMDDTIYLLCMSKASKNPFRKYLEYLNKQHWLTMEEMKIYNGIGREFLDLISTTNMSKVYKMPILYAFLQDGKLKTEITDQDVLKTWKEFFQRGTNWKDLFSGKGNKKRKSTYQDYLNMTDKEHLRKAYQMPIHYLLASSDGFFIKKDGYALAVRDDLKEMFQNETFVEHYKDILDYRTVDYYRRRYEDSQEGVFLFEKKVDKSLLKDGMAIPKKLWTKVFQEMGFKLKRGEKHIIKIVLDEKIYVADLRFINNKSDGRVQIRYTASSEIHRRLNEIFTVEDKDCMIKVYAIRSETLRFVY